MSMYECPKCGGAPGVTTCCTDDRRAQPAQAEAVPPGFIDFARDVLADFPHGFPDGFDLNDLAIKHGLLIGKTVTERCGEFCVCAEYHGEDELKDGVTCYHRHAAIAQQKGANHG